MAWLTLQRITSPALKRELSGNSGEYDEAFIHFKAIYTK